MQQQTEPKKLKAVTAPKQQNGGKMAEKKPLKLNLPVDEFRSIPIPGVGNAKLGVAYVRVTDLPAALDEYMEVNPRVPSRSKKGLLSGPVVQGIVSTLRETPEEMVLKNRGIYLLVDEVGFSKGKGSEGQITMTFSDPGKHGIVDGGHTYAAIREAIETAAEGEEQTALKDAYVRLHIFQGVDEDFVPEIAEGLNRSRAVDDPSLVNLQGEFDIIRKVLKGVQGENSVAYHQGDEGQVYISELLVYLSLFNQERFDERKHPNALYNRQALGLKYFTEDMESSKKNMMALIQKLPDFLWLADSIRKMTPEAAKRNGFKFGAAKIGGDRAGSSKNKGTLLPFISETVNYRVPNGWVYPMLSAFRANLKRSEDGKSYEWRVPLAQILPEVIEDLVGVCVVEHRDNNMRPELIGKRESAYSQCYTKVQLYLAKRNLLN